VTDPLADGDGSPQHDVALLLLLLLLLLMSSQAISRFCLLAVVGMLLGIAFGAATSYLLEHIFR
jgi:uncharacterized membrane protein